MGVQGMLTFYSHFIYITNILSPSPQPSTCSPPWKMRQHATPRLPQLTQPVPPPTNTSPQPKHQNMPTRTGSSVPSSLPHLEHQNASLWTCSGVQTLLSTTWTPRVTFFVSGMIFHTPPPPIYSLMPQQITMIEESGRAYMVHPHVPLPFPPLSPFLSSQNTRTILCGLILVFGHIPSSLPCLEHYNMSVWACSGALEHQNKPTQACSIALAPPLPHLKHQNEPTQAHLYSLCLVFTFLVNFYISIVLFFVFNFM